MDLENLLLLNCSARAFSVAVLGMSPTISDSHGIVISPPIGSAIKSQKIRQENKRGKGGYVKLTINKGYHFLKVKTKE